MAATSTPPDLNDRYTYDSIWRLYLQLEGRDAAIQGIYLTTLVDLEINIDNPAFTFYEKQEDRKRRWWESDNSDRSEFVHIDRLSQIIEDQRTNLGVGRSVRIPPPPPDFFTPQNAPASPDGSPVDLSAAARDYADYLELVCLDLWREWSIARQWSLLGWYAVLFGSGIGVLEWSEDRGIPVFRVRSPRGFYAVARPDDDTRIQQALFVQWVTGTSLALAYPNQCGNLAASMRLRLVDYYDSDRRMRYVEGVEAPLIDEPNVLGRVPVYIFPNIIMPGIYGTTLLPRAIPMQEELDRLFTQDAELMTDAVQAPMVVNDPINTPQGGFTWSRKSTVEVGPQGRVGRAPIDTLPIGAMGGRINMVMSMLDNTMDFSQMQRGAYEGDIVTGKGVNSLLSPSASRNDHKLGVQNEIASLMMEDALLMLKEVGKKRKAGHGVKNGTPFSMMIDPAKIDPEWVKVQVFVDTASMMDQQAAEVTRIQKVRGTPSLMSAQTAMELDPSITNVGDELKRIDKEQADEQAKQLAMMQAQQQMMQPQGGAPAGQPGNAAVPEDVQNYGAERGGAIPGGPPVAPATAAPTGPQTPPPGGAAPAGPMPPGGPPLPTPGAPDPDQVVQDLQGFLSSIPNLHGTVYLCGLSAQGDLTLGVEVYCDDPTDKATITNAFKNDPILKEIHDKKGVHFLPDKPDNAMSVGGPQTPTPGGPANG